MQAPSCKRTVTFSGKAESAKWHFPDVFSQICCTLKSPGTLALYRSFLRSDLHATESHDFYVYDSIFGKCIFTE